MNDILDGFVAGLVVAWILTWFDVDIILLEVIQPFVSIQLTISHYYVLLAFLGLLSGAFSNKN